jgi:hypothetical protein
MKLWRIELDQEEDFWLSELMKTIVKADDNGKPVKFEPSNQDIVNAKDIIMQIGRIDNPLRKSSSRSVKIVDIKKEYEEED